MRRKSLSVGRHHFHISYFFVLSLDPFENRIYKMYLLLGSYTRTSFPYQNFRIFSDPLSLFGFHHLMAFGRNFVICFISHCAQKYTWAHFQSSWLFVLAELLILILSGDSCLLRLFCPSFCLSVLKQDISRTFEHNHTMFLALCF